MSKISFENYGNRARQCANDTVVAGRYVIQSSAEKLILPDIIGKLALAANDSLLDIGCGAGNLTIPLSFWVKDVTGIDHPSCIERFQRRFCTAAIKLVSGNFLEIEIHSRFDKILCYSVLHYLSDEAEVFAFIDKALALLVPGGRVLFGDIPNTSKKRRFLASAHGQQFEREWRNEQQRCEITTPTQLTSDSDLVQFDDQFLIRIMRRYRSQGFYAYILPEDPELPFGHTREDIVIAHAG
jgi:2-polyprenyl-3-methyl-5-hydroxy-6-metoxy-1,4-benzoquinol methylase